LLVSHDRAFLDNVVTSVMVFEGDGLINEYIGGYADWFELSEKAKKVEAVKIAAEAPKKEKPKAAPPAKKLSFKEQRELEQLPARIEQLENLVAELNAKVSDPGFYKQSQDAVNLTLEALQAHEAELTQSYQRWDELEALQNPS